MRVLLQRVTEASVQIGAETIAAISRGYLLLTGISNTDSELEVGLVAEKIANLRINDDANGALNRSGAELIAAGESFSVLVVSQFTLYADCRKGRRPSFVSAAPGELAEPLVQTFATRLVDIGFHVECGRFGAEMLVKLVNDGPVTIWLDTAELRDRQSNS